MGTMQTVEGKSNFCEYRDNLIENLKSWEYVWKIEKTLSLQTTMQHIISKFSINLEVIDKLDQLCLDILKKHFEIILIEIKKKRKRRKRICEN